MAWPRRRLPTCRGPTRTPPPAADEPAALGYRIVIFPSAQTWLSARADQELLDEVLNTGTSMGPRHRMMPFDGVDELLGPARRQT